MSTSEGQKWLCVAVAGLIFLLVSAPFTYDFTDYVGTRINDNLHTNVNGKPTLGGLLLHLVVFMLLLRLSMFIPY
jgi:hypothetical protein